MLVCDQTAGIDPQSRRQSKGEVRVALLGLGRIGTAVARLAAATSATAHPIRVLGALVKDPQKRTHSNLPVTADAAALLDADPDVVVEVLGGTEPAREIVLRGLTRGLPVVTANKTLMAVHGDELLETADKYGASLRYEAAVIAGVPFLGTLACRPFAGSAHGFEAVLNGTTNFILSALENGAVDFASALAEAQHLGFAEPDPSRDVSGADAAEKLCVLVRHFGAFSIAPSDVSAVGIESLTSADLMHARELGGAIKPVAVADWSNGCLRALVGPAFTPFAHPLAKVDGAENGILVHGERLPPLFFAGAGAGPEPTAATILDDVVEAARGGGAWPVRAGRACRVAPAAVTSWFVRLESSGTLPSEAEIADLFAGFGLWIRRASQRESRSGMHAAWLLTHPCAPGNANAALAALCAAASCRTSRWPSLGERQ